MSLFLAASRNSFRAARAPTMQAVRSVHFENKVNHVRSEFLCQGPC